jgi:DNA-binding PadR family transcriptional regulator
MARNESLRGTLNLLILRALSLNEELSGFAIKQRIIRASEGVLVVGDGSLYPALDRMRRAGWVVCYVKRTYRRKARMWIITKKGETQFSAEERLWVSFRSTVNGLLKKKW